MGEVDDATEVDNVQGENKPIFRDINADDVPEITEIESLCMACEEQGTTRLFLTKIPFFQDTIIMSFDCPHCHYRECEVKPGSDIHEQGVRMTLKVDGAKMMNRQIIRQASAMFRVEELDFEAPAFTSKGAFTNVEGLLETAIMGLEQQQPVRRIMQVEVAEKIDDIIAKLTKYKTGEVPFTLIMDDTSGNSFIENPYAPEEDSSLKVERYERSREQNERLGIMLPEEDDVDEKDETTEGELNLKDEVLEFPSNCSNCQTPAPVRMKVINIPHFKEVVIMALSCESCGFKSNEVKPGGAMEPLGMKIKFEMTDPTDLTRDVLTSETCCFSIPEFEIEINSMSMGGKFTTLEGLLVNVREQIGKINPFAFGDSSEKENTIKGLVEKLDKIISGEVYTTILLDDPIGNSYLQNLYAPDEDPNMTIEKYERTPEQDAELGISDMKTEDYC